MMTRLAQLVLVTLVAVLGAAAPATAQGLAWIQAGPVGDGARPTDTYDREFIREWESNPPKGFATLSKNNIEPTKAAIEAFQRARGLPVTGQPTLALLAMLA